MLTSLHIKNFAIVAELDLDFNSGMTALTGETGAGKSIMIDALLLVCLALVRLGCGRLCHHGQRESGKYGDQQTGCAFHCLLLVFGMGQPHAQNNAGGRIAPTPEM